MTNLSDLFPAGAGKQVSFVADGAISSGDTVSLETSGKVKKITSGNANVARFIGIADAGISDTDSGNVTIKGGISTNVSSLTAGTDYYCQADGSIGTSSGGSAVKMGKAMSATSINLEYSS